ncbi:MAG: flagellar hook-basal body complex protein FliE [Rickettsiales bacterium TMED254]|nr:flagellar hook-basal body complex protein FliE [Rickettsiales bacterium]RPF75967.1 MAG: flagellar hook-basal body complex protein FliE [Rickettsiales bacterium TMED254]
MPSAIEAQDKIKNLQEKIIDQTKKTLGEENVSENFINNLTKALENVSDNQMKSAELTKNFELGIENDLTKVMIQQNLASLGFQMTLNVRNKVLSAYKDIMNMPV